MKYGNIKLNSDLDANGQDISNSNNLFGKTTTKTVNFDNTMSAAAIQALIDAEDKIVPQGTVLTFQFADGTYTQGVLNFNNFSGGGRIDIQGNSSESGQHTNQAVVINGGGDKFFLRGTKCPVRIRFIRANLDLSASGWAFIRAEVCSHISAESCYVNGDSIVRGVGFIFQQVFDASVEDCLITQTLSAIQGNGLEYFLVIMEPQALYQQGV